MTAPLYVATWAGLAVCALLVWSERAKVRADMLALRMWWGRIRRAHRAEQQQPNAGLGILGPCCPHPHTHRSFADHVDDALDIFPIDDGPEAELLAAGQQLRDTDPADLLDLFYRETSDR